MANQVFVYTMATATDGTLAVTEVGNMASLENYIFSEPVIDPSGTFYAVLTQHQTEQGIQAALEIRELKNASVVWAQPLELPDGMMSLYRLQDWSLTTTESSI
jgi:hypothetical protein